MQEAYKAILSVVGLMLLLTSAIIIIAFLVWVVKLEFEWFFGLNIFKWFHDGALKFKLKLLRILKRTRDEVDDANNHGEIKTRRKNVKLNEDMN